MPLVALSRRDVMTAGLSSVVLGCERAERHAAKIDAWPRRSTHEGVEVIELFPNGADETSPLVVAIHGMGDTPDNWIDGWRTFPARVQIVLPRAFTPHGGGFSWFTFRDGMTDAEFGAAVGAAEARLWAGIAKLAGARRLIVTGFSQGAFLSFAFASRHPDKVAYAFPVSGSCPGPLLPAAGVRAAPVIAFHGTTDGTVAFKWGRAAVDGFKERGSEASLREYPGVGHTITAPMKADLWAEIEKALPLLR